jgi:hypothetical protein
MDTFVSFLTLEGVVSVFLSFSMMSAIDLPYIAFVMLRYVCFICSFSDFYQESMLNFLKGFFCTY